MTSSNSRRCLVFGRSPDGKLFALAFDDAIQVRTAWDGPATAVLQWPSGQEGLRPGYCVNGEIDKAHIKQLVVFPDGQRALLALREGVFVVSRSGATRLLPGAERYKEHFEWLPKEYPNDPLTLTIDMEHGAVSPHGDLVLAGCQDSKHIVFDSELRHIATLGPLSEYPHLAWFSADGKLAAFNACHFCNGPSIAVPAQELAGLNTDYDERHPNGQQRSDVGVPRSSQGHQNRRENLPNQERGYAPGDGGKRADAGALAPLHPVRPTGPAHPFGPKAPAKSTAGPAGGKVRIGMQWGKKGPAQMGPAASAKSTPGCQKHATNF
jgi:hypothetical protein